MSDSTVFLDTEPSARGQVTITSTSDFQASDFVDFLKEDGARIAFDYERYRVVVYRPGTATAFVYDLSSETWATMQSSIMSSIEGFPTTQLNLTNNDGKTDFAVFSLENGEPIGEGRACYLTRPLKLGEADVAKTVRNLIERGSDNGGTSRILALWGSRDMRRWHLVGAVNGARMPRLGGTPYKYFIVGGWVRMSSEGESVSRLTLECQQKYTDRVR